MLSLTRPEILPIAQPALMIAILAVALFTGAVLVGLEMRAEARDRNRLL